MDLFEYLPQYQVLVCKSCHYAVSPLHLHQHLPKQHRDIASCRTKKDIQAVLRIVTSAYDLKDPACESMRFPPSNSPPLPHLLLREGFRCLECSYANCRSKSMSAHVNKQHQHLRRRRGKPTALQREENRTRPRWEAVFCQRFFVHGPQSAYFVVVPLPQRTISPTEYGGLDEGVKITPEDLLRAEIDRQLGENTQTIETWQEKIPNAAKMAEVSPWLEMTRWPKYLNGYGFTETARLADRPHATMEPLLVEFVESLGRVVENGHRSIQEDKVNVFDQARINSFIQRRRASDRPLMVKLAKPTWRKYISIWQRLICFAYRTVQPRQAVQLSHRMTNAQMSHLDQAICHGQDLLNCRAQNPDTDKASFPHNPVDKLQAKLDKAILLFCVSLLDHTLRGDLFESTVVGFLAVLGIDVQKQVLQDACAYTPNLSGLIKIGQILVIQRSVVAAAEGEIEHPADILDEMRERFMIHGSRSPFNWALRLRAYGKKIRNSTTSLGYIQWSEDKEKLSYKTTELPLQHFKEFVRMEVELAQTQMENLLLLHPDECKEATVPAFRLRHLKDDPSNNTRSWSFLVDSRNHEELSNKSRWLLDRILNTDWLRDEFLKLNANGRYHWLSSSVDQYLSQVDEFLERLLLLIHITSGQPARGTEIVSLRYHNTVEGHLRNIFIEDGLVSTVTAYHKGYSITASTKIIHRYLPKEIGELVIYYLWLVRPFTEKLRLLAFGEKEPPSPFLWAKGDTCWDSRRLTNIIKTEAQRYLKTHLNVNIYRHVAIAISKEHLNCGGFKRDYDLEENHADNQATHQSWIAGTIYARGMEEAAGHVKARRQEYRAVSREWHEFLGFQTYLPTRKRPLGEIENNSRMKRRR